MTALKSSSSHVLLTLGVLFTTAGVARFLPNGEAFAENVPQTEQPAEIPAPAAEPAQPPPKAKQVCLDGAAADLFEEDHELFETEKQALTEEKIALQSRAADLEKQLAELTALQSEIEARWKEMQGQADADLAHLAQMYTAMKPDQAASIFNQMDPAFAAGFLRMMPSEQAGLVLAGMDAKKAYALSVRLASMNQDVRASAP